MRSFLASSRLLIILVLLPAFTLTSFSEDPLIFSITGDGPYGDEDWNLIPKYYELERQSPQSEFVIHLGDLNKGSANPGEDYYQRAANLYKKCPIPIIFTIGDNEWNDHTDPDFSREIWNRLFLPFPDNFSNSPTITRQHNHEENMVWVTKNVLFIGINLVGGKVHDESEWKIRHQDDAEWLINNLKMYKDQSQSVVIFAHARPSSKHDDFFDLMIPAVQDYEKPALYIHGDGHTWQYEPHWRTSNLLRVQVDQIAKAPFAQVTVDHNKAIPFQFNRRIRNN